jgi:hypothetical protein
MAFHAIIGETRERRFDYAKKKRYTSNYHGCDRCFDHPGHVVTLDLDDHQRFLIDPPNLTAEQISSS